MKAHPIGWCCSFIFGTLGLQVWIAKGTNLRQWNAVQINIHSECRSITQEF